MPEGQVVVTDPRLDPHRLVFEGIDVSQKPLFTVSEVAKVFFAKSPHWVRWRERSGFFVLDGVPVGQQRTAQGARRYTLADIEKMAHALAEQGAITAAELNNTVLLTQTCAKLYGYL